MTGRRGKAQAGKVVGNGKATYGLRYITEPSANGKERVCGLEPDPITGPIVREALLALRTRSTLDVAADLNARNTPAPGGGRWNATTLRCMAINPVYRGEWVYARNGDPISVTVEPALLSPAEWDTIQAALKARRFVRRGQQPPETDPYLLRQKLICGHCGGVMRTMTNNGFRYYACGCFRPSDARRLGRPSCDLPATYAIDLEAEVWRLLTETLLDPVWLEAGLAAGVAHHQQQAQERRERIAAFDVKLAQQRSRLDGIAGKLVDLGDGALYEAMLAQAKTIEELIDRFEEQRAELLALPSDGLSADEATAIVAFATEMQTGIAHATDADKRRLYDILRLHGTVHTDPEGIRLGQRHRYRIDWTAAIPLRDSDQDFLKTVLLLHSGGEPRFSLVAA